MCLLFVFVLLFLSILPQNIWPDTAVGIDLTLRHLPPSVKVDKGFHLFGTDQLGRDILFRLCKSTRLTLLIALSATLFSTITGIAAGLCAGYFRGYVDAVIQQLVDTLLSIPSLLLVLALVAAFGRTLIGLMLVLGVSGWAQYTRVIRGVAISLSEAEFVDAAVAISCGPLYIMGRHLLPNALSSVVVLSTLTLSQVILIESALSFLGLGPAPPQITWGGMIGEGRNYIYQAWWSSVFPGGVICLTVLTMNYFGDLVREAFDPFTVRQR